MDELIKILLGSEDIIIRDNEDSFINVDLSRSSRELKAENVDNDFSLVDQYDKERNESLMFCIYGTAESKYVDCTNLTINVKTSDNDIMISPKKTQGAVSATTFTIKTIPLSSSGSLSKNIYDNEKASYFFLFELDRAALNRKLDKVIQNNNIPKNNNIILTINDPAKNIFDVIEIPFIFYDETGEFIQYGTKTTDIDVEGDLSEIDNDFSFFYNRHWVRTNIQPAKLASVSFVPAGGLVVVPENITGGTYSARVDLDFPSKSGRESVTIVLDKDSTIMNPNVDFIFVPQTLKWNAGDVSKTFNVNIVDDLFVEGNERVSFKFGSIKNVQLDNAVNGEFEIEIQDNDIPAQARFSQNTLRVSQSASTVSFIISLDKPVAVAGQSIDVVVVNGVGTTATIGTDFRFVSQGNIASDRITIFFKQGDTGATFSVDVLDDFGYGLDKMVEFRFENPSQNIEISTTQNARLDLTITDSMVDKFTRYVFPADFQFGHGAFRVNRKTGHEQYEWSLNSNDAAFTDVFPFTLEITNVGEPVVFGGVLVNKGDIILIKDFSSGMKAPFTIDLPANSTPNIAGKFFENTEYVIKFINIQSNVDLLTEGATIFSSNKYDDVPVVFETKPAGDFGEKKFYLVSEILNMKSAYDATNNACLTTVSTSLSDIKINGVGFIPKSTLVSSPTAYAQTTRIVPFFKSKPIQDHCTFDGSVLPFGFGPALDPPYADRFVDLSLRELFVQVGKSNDIDSKLLLETSQNISPDSSAFYDWGTASENFKNDIEIQITNIGTKDVKIFGKDAGEGDTVTIRQSDIVDDFSGLTLRLEGNTLYSKDTNSFNGAKYAISFTNVNFYDKDGTLVDSNITKFSIQPFTIVASDVPNVPKYLLVSEFEDVGIRTNSNNVFSCAGTSFGNVAKVQMRGMLFTNSKTDFITSLFVENDKDIDLSCPTDVFKFKII